MDALIIAGHYSMGRRDSLRHTDGYRLAVDGVTMTLPNLVEYFRNGRRFDNAEKRRNAEERRPYRQVYWSGLHMLNLLLRNGWQAELIHCHEPTDRSRLKLYAAKPKVVVISTTFMNIDAVRAVVEDVRAHCPDALVVVGGAYSRYSYLVLERQADPLYAVPEVADRYFFTTARPVEGIDLYVTDQHGELALLDIMNAVKGGQARPQGIANTIAPDGAGGWAITGGLPEQYDIVEHRIRWRDMPRSCLSTVVPFQNTYGCPFKCNFCNFSLTKVHKKSLDELMEELLELAEHDLTHTVWFTDDNFFLNEKLITEFCERYIAAGAPFQWNSFVRASSITPKTARLLKEARCSLLILGLESGSQTVLDAMNKKDTVEHYLEAITLLVDADIDLELSFIFGFPGETQQTVQETIEFIKRVPASPTQRSYLYLFTFNVLPLSPIFEQVEREPWGLVGNYAEWRHNGMSSSEVPALLRQVAAAGGNTVFNYIDPPMGLGRAEMKELMIARDVLARHIIAHGDDAAAAPLWADLEAIVRRHFPWQDVVPQAS